MSIDKSKTDQILAKYEELTGTMSDPAVASNPDVYLRYSKEMGAIALQVEAIRKYESCETEIDGLLEMLSDMGSEDSEMRELRMPNCLMPNKKEICLSMRLCCML